MELQVVRVLTDYFIIAFIPKKGGQDGQIIIRGNEQYRLTKSRLYTSQKFKYFSGRKVAQMLPVGSKCRFFGAEIDLKGLLLGIAVIPDPILDIRDDVTHDLCFVHTRTSPWSSTLNVDSFHFSTSSKHWRA